MKISEHANRTEKLYGIRAEDIHKWIDGFFDYDRFDHALQMGSVVGRDPYDHRRFRHCKEALEEAYSEFESKYSRQQIKDVFEAHIKDDYDGYLPSRTDFENGTFKAKYHDARDSDELRAVLSANELAEYFDGLHATKEEDRRFFTRFSLRIVAPSVLALVLFVSAIIFMILPFVEDSMVNQKRQMLAELTSSAVSIVDSYVELDKRGVLSRQEAQSRASTEIGAMRYGSENKDYFFIIDMHPNMVMHPYRLDLTGQDLTDYHDIDGVAIFVEFTKLVQAQQHGFLEYLWQWNDRANITAPKLTYVEGIEEWQWIIGTGVYFDDVQQGIDKLEGSLYQIFAAIFFGLLICLGFVMSQSKSIENRKKRAELALHEAKDRYRALVESSNEGYILETDGNILYSNDCLHRMVGYSESELRDHSIWHKLFPESPQNSPVVQHLQALFSQAAEPGEFEAQLRTKSGNTVDILLSSSRIFLSEKQGHVLSFRPITRKIYGGSFGLVEQVSNYQELASIITTEIEQSQTQGHAVDALNRLADVIREMIESGSRPDILRRTIGTAYDAAIRRFIDLTISEIGEPPVPFSFISFGSNARHDMTLFSDQDNAIVFETPDPDDLKMVRRYFLHLAENVCAMLNQAGYRYCEGLIMASNHQWCLSLEEWNNNFSHWIEQATPKSILELNVFFDIRATYGDPRLIMAMQDNIQVLLRHNPAFLPIYAKNCLAHKVPVTMTKHIKTERLDGQPTLNLKECLRPMEIFCRIYALKHDIRESNTVTRLKQLAAKQEIDAPTLREMLYVFDHIWHLRFMNQIVEYTDLRKINDNIVLNELSSLERQHLEAVLNRIVVFHEKVQRDFLK
ncbi:DUF294 nucleotidyltransferase-like domain-containing protein [Vibrio mediterranei]|uniref:DUF294 nucleotidyltransferase-like domain-containing protein n=1 Tax=Vibrio mediterranei TaxID=689 RepID=UPI004067BF25